MNIADPNRSIDRRPRILHWFVLVACVYFYFSIWNLLGDPGPFRSNLPVQIFGALYGIFFGGMLAGGVILAARAILRGWRKSVDAPCHWLVIGYALSHLVFFAVSLGLGLVVGQADDRLPYAAIYPSQGVFLGAAVLATYRLSNRLLWSSFYGVEALVAVLVMAWAGLYWLGYADFWLTLLPDLVEVLGILLLLAASVIDWRKRRQYDWIHWMAVVSHTVLSLVSLYWNAIGWRFAGIAES